MKLILISLLAACAWLTACGQKGNLYLPTEPAAQGRATLPQVLNPVPSPARASSAPRS